MDSNSNSNSNSNSRNSVVAIRSPKRKTFKENEENGGKSAMQIRVKTNIAVVDGWVVGWNEMDDEAKRFLVMVSLTGSYLMIELVYGTITNSLALISDAFHMMSDVLALIIGYIATRMAKQKKTKQFSYGFVRAEIVSALVNAVFLLSVCVFIIFEAVGRFADPPDITASVSLMVVGGIGLGINILGLILFGEAAHGHSHAHGSPHAHSHSPSHSHSHGAGSSCDHDDHADAADDDDVPDLISKNDVDVECQHDHSHAGNHHGHHGHHGHGHGGNANDEKSGTAKARINLNIKAVYLHVLGDALGSVAVLIVGAFVTYSNLEGRYYADPAVSLFISAIIIYNAWPVAMSSALILLQTSPNHIDTHVIEKEILQSNKQILAIHEFHVWELINAKTIASVHLHLDANADFMPILMKIKEILHKHDIHVVTVQPEFLSLPQGYPSTGQICEVSCTQTCTEDTCCTDDNDDGDDGGDNAVGSGGNSVKGGDQYRSGNTTVVFSNNNSNSSRNNSNNHNPLLNNNNNINNFGYGSL